MHQIKIKKLFPLRDFQLLHLFNMHRYYYYEILKLMKRFRFNLINFFLTWNEREREREGSLV